MTQKRAHVFLPEALLADIDQFVGKGKRSSFIAEIVEREMQRQQLLLAIKEAKGFWKDENHPELRNGSAAWVGSLRAESESRLPADA